MSQQPLNWGDVLQNLQKFSAIFLDQPNVKWIYIRNFEENLILLS